MNAKRFSHAVCAHPSTKVARAKCRREMSRAVTVETVAAAALVATPLMLMPAPAALTRTETCSLCPAEFETIAPESFDIDPVCHRHTLEEATDVRVVTRETWREFKSTPGVIVTTHDAETAETSYLNVQLTGWSDKLIQFKHYGKTLRIPVAQLVSVTV